MTIDYCNNNDIQYILRGVRNFHDMSYEQEMAEYNYKNGGVTTLIMPAKEFRDKQYRRKRKYRQTQRHKRLCGRRYH